MVIHTLQILQKKHFSFIISCRVFYKFILYYKAHLSHIIIGLFYNVLESFLMLGGIFFIEFCFSFHFMSLNWFVKAQKVFLNIKIKVFLKNYLYFLYLQ